MTRPFAIAAMILLAIAVYAALLLWPYDFSGADFGNGAEALQGGGVRFERPGIALAKDPPAWLEPAMRTQALDLSLRFRADSADQRGPARLITLSKDVFARNLTIAQDGADLTLRLRLPETDENGLIEKRPVLRLPNVFPTPGWVDLEVSIRPDSLRVKKDGETVLDTPLPAGALRGWDSAYDLALGNEHSLNRPWLGEIETALIRSGESVVDYAHPEALRLPAAIVITTKPPKLTPLSNLKIRDTVINLLLFTPFGLLLGLLIRRSADPGQRWRLAVGAILLIALISTTFETLQIFVPPRAPSIDDVIFNTLGGALMILALVMTRMRPSPKCGV